MVDYNFISLIWMISIGRKRGEHLVRLWFVKSVWTRWKPAKLYVLCCNIASSSFEILWLKNHHLKDRMLDFEFEATEFYIAHLSTTTVDPTHYLRGQYGRYVEVLTQVGYVTENPHHQGHAHGFLGVHITPVSHLYRLS